MTEVPADVQERFENFFKSRHQKLFAFCYRVVQHYDDALRASEAAWRIGFPIFEQENESLYEPEIFKAAAAACVEVLRRQGNVSRVSPEDLDEEIGLLEEVDWEMTGLRDLAYRVQSDRGLKRAFNGISPKQRIAIILKYHYGASSAETSRVLDCGIGTARTYLRSGLLSAAKLFNSSEEASTRGV